MPGWSTGRPIYHRLPQESEAYQGNALVDALTKPYDNLLMAWKGLIDNFERDFLDPGTCRSDALDWLAQLCGFTGEYWDPTWAEPVKRELIRRSHSFIWQHKGSQMLLEWLLELFSIEAQVYMLGQFILGTNVLGDTLGGELLRYWVLLPLKYRRSSEDWALAERLNRLYMPVFADSAVVYDRFYLGFSVLGDPLL